MAVGFVLITTEPGAEVSVREAVSKIGHVSGQWIVFGMHDLFAVSYTHLRAHET